jgi:predicted DNA-binding transcriptional regulator AlpA
VNSEVLHAEQDIGADPLELVDCDAACRVLGGNRPLNRATLYKGVKDGRYPKPVHPGPATSRWVLSELIECKRSWIERRDGKAA